MNNETGVQAPFLHTLIPPADFKAILGIDDREDCLDFASVRNQGYEFLHGKNSTHLFQPPSLAAFCLITATYTIEQHCKRRLLLKRHFERIAFHGDLILLNFLSNEDTGKQACFGLAPGFFIGRPLSIPRGLSRGSSFKLNPRNERVGYRWYARKD
jgi:hypothetical protein